MNKHLIIVGLLISLLFGLGDDIPFDWSGQYGVITNNGRLMWSQDWTVGVLFIDGTYANYPTRFGSSYKNNYKLSNTGDFYKDLHSFPDSSQILSRIDYCRGDFSYDQLEIDAESSKINRIICINGFKRAYKGPYGQYINSQGNNNPLQQSYRLDYSSKDKNEILDLSVGYFITDSRLNLGDPADFVHKEKIISAGIGYLNYFATWQYKAHGALFQQYYNMDYDSVKTYLNRIHLNQFISKKIKNSTILKFGIELDNQELTLVDTAKKNRLWTTIYSGWEKKNVGIKIGSTFGKSAVAPLFGLIARSNEKRYIKWQSNLRYEAVPIHLFLWQETYENMFERWIISQSEIQLKWKNIPIIISIDYFYNKNNNLVHRYYNNGLIEISNHLLSSTFSTHLPLFKDWNIYISYRHTFEHNIYSDAIGDNAQLGLIVTKNLFNNNLHTKLNLWSDAYFNRNQILGYDGFHYGPYITDDKKLALHNYCVFNLELSARVSKMTIMWKVNNILKTAESIANQIFPKLNDNYLLIMNSNNFPPMNRFVTFNIIWNFKD